MRRRPRRRPLLRVLVAALVAVLAATRLLVDGVPEMQGWQRWAGHVAGWGILFAAIGWAAWALVARLQWRWYRAARHMESRLDR